jgi:hypothetical protein
MFEHPHHPKGEDSVELTSVLSSPHFLFVGCGGLFCVPQKNATVVERDMSDSVKFVGRICDKCIQEPEQAH